MIFRYKKTTVNHKGKEYTICVPKYEFTKNTFLNELNTKDFYIVSSNTDHKELSDAMHFIAEHKDIILYIPFSKNKNPFLGNARPYMPPQLDLVCVHHSMQFRQKEWKEIRNKIKNNFVNCNFDIDDKELPHYCWSDFFKSENNDYIDIYKNFSTLIITGSSKTFNFIADRAFELSQYKYNDVYFEHEHLSELFKRTDKKQEWREVSLYLIDKIENY
ncbi:MAG: hypothetical protein AB1Z23_03165 [Eubacteriales bacterium]